MLMAIQRDKIDLKLNINYFYDNQTHIGFPSQLQHSLHFLYFSIPHQKLNNLNISSLAHSLQHFHLFLFTNQTMGCEQTLIANSQPTNNRPSRNNNIYPQTSLRRSSVQSLPSHLQLCHKQLTGKELLLISKTLEKHILFYKLTKQQKLKVIQSMDRLIVQAKTYVFKENDPPNYAFIVLQGSINIVIQTQDKTINKTLNQGDLFGDLALINAANRSASVYAQTKCEMMGLSKYNFQLCMQQLSKDNSTIALKYISASDIFGRFTQVQQKSLSSNVYQAKFQKDAVVFQLGDVANCLYLIKTGEVQISVPKRPIVCLKEGDVFGEGCLQVDSLRQGQAKALVKTHCLIISRHRLSLCMQAKDLRGIVFECTLKWSFRRSSKFAQSSTQLIDRLIKTGVIQEYEDNAILINAGEKFAKLFICLEGSIVMEDLLLSNKSEIIEIGVGMIINLNQGKMDVCARTYVKKGKGHVYSLGLDDLQSIISHKQSTIDTADSAMQMQGVDSPICSIELKQLQLIQKYEANDLGIVLLVRQRFTSNYFILRCCIKNKIIQQKRQQLLIRQKQLNFSLQNQFIAVLLKTYQDRDFIYLLYKQYPNLTLQGVCQQMGAFSNELLQFFIVNFIVRMEYIHDKLILIRDLQTDNWVINRQGYPCLVNFAMGKKLVHNQGFKTFTIIGSPHYMAPQVHQGLGYTFAADIWSLGILIYLLAVGYFPFGEGMNDPYDIFMAIQTQPVVFPGGFQHKKLKKIIKNLLVKDSWNRQDLSLIKKGQYFSEYSDQMWRRVERGAVKCPYDLQKMLGGIVYPEPKSSTSVFEYLQKQRNQIGAPLRSVLSSSWDQKF